MPRLSKVAHQRPGWKCSFQASRRAPRLHASSRAAATSAGDTTLVRISRDPYSDPAAQHRAAVGPALAVNEHTLLATFQVGRFVGSGSDNIGWAASIDGGKSWRNLGLRDTHHISRVALNPLNTNIAYVCALGHNTGPNEERGVFKTTDGGKTWTKVLYINPDTGVNDIAMDPMNPDTIYAAAYQRRRTMFGMNGGGPGSAIYRTTDGGATWKKLTD